MIFSGEHNGKTHIELIREGIKTQTRRINRGVYKVGKDYAVQSKRGAKAEKDIRIVMDRIWHEEIVRPIDYTSFNVISEQDAQAEGGYIPAEFELLFRKLNPGWDETKGRWAFEFHVVGGDRESRTPP